jgi:hypothetical protein
VTGEDVIVLVSEYAESEIIGVRDVDAIMMSEESIGVDGPVGFRIFEMCDVKRVGRKGK